VFGLLRRDYREPNGLPCRLARHAPPRQRKILKHDAKTAGLSSARFVVVIGSPAQITPSTTSTEIGGFLMSGIERMVRLTYTLRGKQVSLVTGRQRRAVNNLRVLCLVSRPCG